MKDSDLIENEEGPVVRGDGQTIARWEGNTLILGPFDTRLAEYGRVKGHERTDAVHTSGIRCETG